MSEFSAAVTIDGHVVPQQILDRIEYERTLHVLHEMKYLGADIKDGERSLSHEDINWLEPERAKQVCLAARTALGEQEMLDLMERPRLDAERRWKEFNEGYRPEDVHMGVTEISIVGASFQEVMGIMNGVVSDKSGLRAFPEHYIVIGDISTGQRGMEAFGMFGEPVFVHGTASEEAVAGLPIEDDPSYPLKVSGAMLLKSDDTPIHTGACHMVRPTQDGFDIKSTFFCPGKAPAAIADGHKYHFALEIVNAARAAYAAKAGA